MADLVESPSEMDWLERIVARGVIDPDAIGKLIDLKCKMEDRLARAAYARDMNACQGETTTIIRGTKNSRTGKMYASLETVLAAVKPLYIKYGFSLSFGEGESHLPDHTRIILDIRHREGHGERYQGDYPLDGKGAKGGEVMNAIQGHVSSNTYGQRDMIRKAFSLVIADTDLDGEPTTHYADAEDIRQINELLDKMGEGKPVAVHSKKVAAFFKWLNVDTLENLTAEGVQKALQELRRQANEVKS